MNNKKIAKLNLPNGKVIELPVMSGSLGPGVIDITSLYRQADMFTFDPGFTSTGSCKSDITFIDGDQGILLHRGYKIEDLAEKSSFLETSYLLMYGDLPTQKQLNDFDKSLKDSRVVVHTTLSLKDGVCSSTLDRPWPPRAPRHDFESIPDNLGIIL